jgi:hypothetical protein
VLKITDAWTNERAGTDGLAVWFAAVNPDGRWWWLIVHLHRVLGFTSAAIRPIGKRAVILRAMRKDEAEGYGGWRSVEPQDALEDVRATFARTGGLPWAQAYTDHFRTVSEAFARFQATVDGTAQPVEFVMHHKPNAQPAREY